jgi:hypothetical protein
LRQAGFTVKDVHQEQPMRALQAAVVGMLSQSSREAVPHAGASLPPAAKHWGLRRREGVRGGQVGCVETLGTEGGVTEGIRATGAIEP